MRIISLKEDFNTDEFVSMEQEFTSKSTAHGNGKANGGEGRVPDLFKHIRYEPNLVIFDYGCGEKSTSNRVKEFVESKDDTYIGYDKYNQTTEEQNDSLKEVSKLGGADIVACANVLNVIKERNVRVNQVIANIYKILKNGGLAYFDVYADKKKAGPKQTGADKWQEFREISTYIDEIEEIFGKDSVLKKGGVLIAKK